MFSTNRAIGPSGRMVQMGHVACVHHNRYCGGLRTHPPEVQSEMPQAYIVIFFLFFAVLAFGWFYWQRAKARGPAEPADASAGSVATTDATPAASTDAAPVASTDASDHVHAAGDEHDHPH
jgi:hypothetical protein